MKTHVGYDRPAPAVRSHGVWAVILLTLVGWSGRPAGGATLADHAHSLRSVPADAAFYSASLRLEEQLDILLASKAYAQLMQVPIVQLAKMQLTFQWQQSPEPAVAKFREYFQSPEGQETFAVVKDMFSQEIFCYGSIEVAEVIDFFAEFNGVTRAARIEALASGRPQDEVVAERILELFKERGDRLAMPDVVFGFRIGDSDAAIRQLDQIHAVLTDLFTDLRPELAERVQREQIAGHEFVALRLDGSLLPWDEIRSGADGVDDATFEKWKSVLGGKTLALAVGVVDEFVLVSMGDSTDHLATYGSGSKLADSPVLARLERHADERITSIGYLSDALAERVGSPRRTMDDLAGVADEGLRALQLDDARREAILADVRALADDVLKYMPAPGAIVAVAYLTERGSEGFQYRLGTLPTLDSSRPLTIFDHVGGSPLLFVASRAKETVEDYDLTVSWLKRIFAHAEEIAEEKVSPEQWAVYQQWRGKGLELLARVDQANREHLYPALADGQTAIILDAEATSDRWHAEMPRATEPLPMLQIALAGSVSDAVHLRAGIAAYFDVVQDTIYLLHEINPQGMPSIALPEPDVREAADGTMYVYPFPAEWGVDPQVALNAGLSESTWAASPFPAFTERLLRATPLKIDTSLDVQRPAAAVSHVQLAKLLGAVRPWIDYGFAASTGQLQDDEDDTEDPGEPTADQSAAMVPAGFILPQIHQLLDVLAAVRSYTSITYQEEDAWVTHSELHVVDLE